MKTICCWFGPVLVSVTVILFTVSRSFAAEPFSKALETIGSSATVDDAAVGFGAVRTKAYDAFVILCKSATKEQLITLTTDSNVNVRAYAAMALRSNFPDENFQDLLMKKLTDEDTFVFFSACEQTTTTIGDFYHQVLSGNLSEAQHAAVLEYLLGHENKLETTLIALSEWNIPETSLPKVRALAEHGNASALIALAKFKREEDYPIIIAAAKKDPFEAFRCIAMNPQPCYFKLLEESQFSLLAEEIGRAHV